VRRLIILPEKIRASARRLLQFMVPMRLGASTGRADVGVRAPNGLRFRIAMRQYGEGASHTQGSFICVRDLIRLMI